MCACVYVKERGGMREGIICRNSNGSTETQHWLDFLIASLLRWMADAAVCANSCLPKKTERTLGGRRENNAGWIIFSLWGILQFHNFKKMHAGLRITFIGNSHLFQGAFPREPAKMHFLCCLGRTETVWCITAESKLKQTMFFCFFLLSALLMWNFWVYKLQFTTVGEPGGLKDLMEQSVWISCRIFVRLELSTVVLLSLPPQPEALWLTTPRL